MTTTIQRFVARCDAYSASRRIKASYLSRLLFDDGKVIEALRAGSDVTVRRLERAEILLGEFERALAKTGEGDRLSDSTDGLAAA